MATKRSEKGLLTPDNCFTMSQVTGLAPAWITRFMAFSCDSWLTSPQQSSTT